MAMSRLGVPIQRTVRRWRGARSLLCSRPIHCSGSAMSAGQLCFTGVLYKQVLDDYCVHQLETISSDVGQYVTCNGYGVLSPD